MNKPVHAVVLACFAPVWLAACNTAPIPPGKSIPIQAALDTIVSDMCAFQQKFAQTPQGQRTGVEAYTVELVLSIDATRAEQPVAVAPDIAFMPTVTYGNTLAMAKDSRLVVTFRNTGATGQPECARQ